MQGLNAAPEIDKRRLIGACARLPVVVDAERLRREVEALPSDVWRSTGDRVGVHRDTGALFLRGHAPAEGERPIVDRPVLGQLPYCRELIETTFGRSAFRCLLARLPGGKHVAAHSDLGPYFARTLRIHVPVISHPRAWMLCDGLCYVMVPGEAWALNNAARHAVWNADPELARTHLICDFSPTPEVLRLLAGAERDLGRRIEAVEREIEALTAERRAMLSVT
jgi:hypothetical protein